MTKQKILVVDDSEVAQETLRELLEEIGYEVYCASSANEAMKVASKHALDLILMDIKMPDVDGIEACRRLKTDKKLCEIPVIMVTVAEEAAHLEPAFEAGAVDYISKPVHKFELHARLKSVLHLKAHERELQWKNKQLKQEILEHKQTEAQLAQQKQNLERTNAELDSFIYMASHDLRAPLRGISSFASILEEECGNKLNNEAKDSLNSIRRGTNTMSELLDDLMTISRITRTQVPFEDVNTHDLSLRVRKRIEFDIKEKKVDLSIQESMPVIRCDRVKMGEVFSNLLNNAIKFSSKDNPENPRIEIGHADQGEFHEFYIRDNGIGIDPKYQDQIFKVFTRLHSATEYEGTGAGLNIVQKVIEEHHGRIWVESEIGKGATFRFIIPKKIQYKKIGKILVEKGSISEDQLQEALTKQKKGENRLPLKDRD